MGRLPRYCLKGSLMPDRYIDRDELMRRAMVNPEASQEPEPEEYLEEYEVTLDDIEAAADARGEPGSTNPELYRRAIEQVTLEDDEEEAEEERSGPLQLALRVAEAVYEAGRVAIKSNPARAKASDYATAASMRFITNIMPNGRATPYWRVTRRYLEMAD